MKLIAKLSFILFLLLINTKISFAAESTHNELGLFTTVDTTCPFSREILDDMIIGEFIRAGLKPSRNLLYNLNVNVNCLEIINEGGRKTGFSVSYEIRYGTQLDDGTNVLIEYPNYGSNLIGGPSASSSLFFVNTIKNSTSSALTDYLKKITE
ncbi:TPA: hypothetical protein ACPJZ3_001632 [Vibrio diabolicus]|uniref:hypothetical protein n=1 Tax=Vibrio diabolicus TaxID=50719 RepID=UPI00215E121B|nr:hypothetical protein [Vibrio diabolicus]MCS0414354.1 hypothetical protein [Vibrio diabolicus]